jgi:hypothetical protein
LNAGDWLPLWGAEPKSSNRQKYTFLAGRCKISLTTRQLPPYVDKPLEFYEGARVQPAQWHWRRFVGSVNLVAINAVDDRGQPCDIRLRERTTIEKRRADVPARAPFEKTVRLINGAGADMQVFGFDLGGLRDEERAQAIENFQGAVEIVNQELFLEDDAEPFAILTWRRSDRDIAIVGVQSAAAIARR